MTLIERLNAAPVGGRELDAEIFLQIVLNGEEAAFPDAAYKAALIKAPRYTTSIDAAVSLVPEGRFWFLGSCLGGGFASHLDNQYPTFVAATAPLA